MTRSSFAQTLGAWRNISRSGSRQAAFCVCEGFRFAVASRAPDRSGKLSALLPLRLLGLSARAGAGMGYSRCVVLSNGCGQHPVAGALQESERPPALRPRATCLRTVASRVSFPVASISHPIVELQRQGRKKNSVLWAPKFQTAAREDWFALARGGHSHWNSEKRVLPAEKIGKIAMRQSCFVRCECQAVGFQVALALRSGSTPVLSWREHDHRKRRGFDDRDARWPPKD